MVYLFLAEIVFYPTNSLLITNFDFVEWFRFLEKWAPLGKAGEAELTAGIVGVSA